MSKHKTITEFDVVDHGVENSQYSQWLWVPFSDFKGIATGRGNDLREAVDEVLKQLARGSWDVEGMDQRIVADGWFSNRRKIPAKPSVPAASDDCYYYYLTIRVK